MIMGILTMVTLWILTAQGLGLVINKMSGE